VVRNTPRRATLARSPTVDRGIEGKEVGEEAQCTSAGERKMGETRDGVGRRLFMAARRRGPGGKGQGVRLGATWGQEKERRGGGGQGAVPHEPEYFGFASAMFLNSNTSLSMYLLVTQEFMY
jgi:hypothetical protein